MPTTTTSPSRISLAPAAAMISVGRGSDIASITENRIRLQFVHPPQTANFFKVFPVILGTRNIRFHVIREGLCALGVIDVEPQMIRVKVIALENRCRMGAKRLVNDGFNTVGRNDGLLRIPLDILGRYKLLCDDDDSTSRFCLFFIFPTSAMNLGVSLVVCNLDMHERDVRIERP